MLPEELEDASQIGRAINNGDIDNEELLSCVQELDRSVYYRMVFLRE